MNNNLFMSQSSHATKLDAKAANAYANAYAKRDFLDSTNSKKPLPTYWLLDGPPYANGSLHLGHFLNKTLKDFKLRAHQTTGHKLQSTCGWDCHGLPLEMVTQKLLGYTAYHSLPPSSQSLECSKQALRGVARQRLALKTLATTQDLHNPYLTMSPQMRAQSYSLLKKLFDKNLLTYRLAPCAHCPQCQSVLSSFEMEKSLKKSSSTFVLYPTNEKDLFTLVWTTTPWSLPMSQAVAYNSKNKYCVYRLNDKRFLCSPGPECQQLLDSLGAVYESDWSFKNQNLKAHRAYNSQNSDLLNFYDLPWVSEVGSGLVHLSAAHAKEDYQSLHALGYEPLDCLDDTLKFKVSSLTPASLHAKDLQSASECVLEQLSKDCLLLSHRVFDAEVDVCWRHKCQVFTKSSAQLFLDLKPAKEKLKKLLQTKLSTNHERLYTLMLQRQDWCLSRQRSWGLPLNLLLECDESTGKKTLHPLSSKGLELLSQQNAHEFENLKSSHPHLTPLEDVADVWFDSGSVYYALKNLTQNTKADFALEGKDQYRGWFQSMAWLALCTCKDDLSDYHLPDFEHHGFVLDQRKEKLSKSKSSGDLTNLLSQYSLDALRLWVASVPSQTDAVFNPASLTQSSTALSRFRLCLRFTHSYSQPLSSSDLMHALDRLDNGFLGSTDSFYYYWAKKTNDVMSDYFELLKNSQNSQALQLLYNFCDKVLSGYVFEVLKPLLYLNAPQSATGELARNFCTFLYLQLSFALCPLTPLLVREFYLTSDLKKDTNYFEQLSFKRLDFNPTTSCADVFEGLFELRQQLTSSCTAGVKLSSCSLVLQESVYLKYNSPLSCLGASSLLAVSDCVVYSTPKDAKVLVAEFSHDGCPTSLVSNPASWQKCPRCWVHKKDVKEVCSDCSEQIRQ